MERREVTSVEEMHRLATEVGGQLQPGDALYLVGELGAGKTTFVQGLAAFFGVERPVTSSTFVLMSSYAITNQPAVQKLVHLDLYRLTAQQVRAEPLVGHVLSTESRMGRVTVVEWADRLDPETTPAGWWVQFEHRDPTTRVVTWKYGSLT